MKKTKRGQRETDLTTAPARLNSGNVQVCEAVFAKECIDQEQHSSKVAYLIFESSHEARISFIRRLVLEILIYTYQVPVFTLSALPDQTWYPSGHTTQSLLSTPEHDLLLYLAHLVTVGTNLATIEDPNDACNRLSPHEIHSLTTHIIEPSRALKLPPECVFDLLHLVTRHNFSNSLRYKTLPHQHAAMLGYLVKHNETTLPQRLKLSKRLLNDAIVLRKVTDCEDTWNAIAQCIRVFGSKHMGRDWQEQIGQEDVGVVLNAEVRVFVGVIKVWEDECKSATASEDEDKVEDENENENEGVLDACIKSLSSPHSPDTMSVEEEELRPENTQENELDALLAENMDDIKDLGLDEDYFEVPCVPEKSVQRTRIAGWNVEAYRAVVEDLRTDLDPFEEVSEIVSSYATEH